MYYIGSQGNIYQCPPSDPVVGDRLATQAEIDVYELTRAKVTQKQVLLDAFNNQAYGLVTFKGTTFQADTESRGRLTATLAGFTATTLPAGFAWTDSLNNAVPMTYTDLQNLLNTGAVQFYAAFQHLQAQKTAVNNATTIQQVQGII